MTEYVIQHNIFGLDVSMYIFMRTALMHIRKIECSSLRNFIPHAHDRGVIE
jgi:hypothetical protein